MPTLESLCIQIIEIVVQIFVQFVILYGFVDVCPVHGRWARNCSIEIVLYEYIFVQYYLYAAVPRPSVPKPYRIRNCTIYSTAETREIEQCDQNIQKIIALCSEKVAKIEIVI